MCIPCGKNFSLIPRSVSSLKIKVKYQGQFRKKKQTYVWNEVDGFDTW